MGKEKVYYTADAMYLTVLMLQRVYDMQYDKNEIYPLSTRRALGDTLYMEELTDKELNDLWLKWHNEHDKLSDTVRMSGDMAQYEQLFKYLLENERIKKKMHANYLKGMDFECCVIDNKAEDAVECSFGSHYEGILALIKKNHKHTFFNLTQEEKDNFIMTNFTLIGNNYDNKQYYVNSVNESIDWFFDEDEDSLYSEED